MASSSFHEMTRMMDYFTYIGIRMMAFTAVLACTSGCKRPATERSVEPPPGGSAPAGSAPAGSATAVPAAAPAPAPSGPCQAAGDCALVDEGCCGCNEGGRRM